MFVKRSTCPVSADVKADNTGCNGRCAVAYLVRYDPYSGESYYIDHAEVASGFAALAAEQHPADFYIGVQVKLACAAQP